jgi:hypothetical protein
MALQAVIRAFLDAVAIDMRHVVAASMRGFDETGER